MPTKHGAPAETGAAGHKSSNSNSHYGTPPGAVKSDPLLLAAAGLSLIPLQPRAKVPYRGFRWKGYQQSGTTTAEVEQWSHRYRGCNWAALWGRASGGVIAVDIDCREAFQWCESQGGLEAETGIFYTTGRGAQWLFRVPPHLLDARGAFPHPGVEVRASGMYSVIPPSVHPSGKQYSWWRAPRAIDEIPVAPQWVQDALARRAADGTADESIPTTHAAKSSPKQQATACKTEERDEAVLCSANRHLLSSSVCRWLSSSTFLKGSRRMAFYDHALILKGAGWSYAAAWRRLKSWRQHHTHPVYGGPGDDDPGEPRRIFDTVWRNSYRPTVRHLREPMNSKGQRVTEASARALCGIYPDTRPRSDWKHEPAIIGVFRILETLARNRIGLARPEPLSHAELAKLTGISIPRIMHAAAILKKLGVRTMGTRGRSQTSHYSIRQLQGGNPHTVCRLFVSCGGWKSEIGWLWRKVMRFFAQVIRRLTDALNSLRNKRKASLTRTVGLWEAGALVTTHSRGPPDDFAAATAEP